MSAPQWPGPDATLAEAQAFYAAHSQEPPSLLAQEEAHALRDAGMLAEAAARLRAGPFTVRCLGCAFEGLRHSDGCKAAT